jgi:hypothetical protein
MSVSVTFSGLHASVGRVLPARTFRLGLGYRF